MRTTICRHFLRIEKNCGRREFVMFDADGPGAIVRWWMTFYKAQNGIIRIYMDNDSVPIIEGSPAEVLSGDLLAEYPFSASVHEGAPLWGRRQGLRPQFLPAYSILG